METRDELLLLIKSPDELTSGDTTRQPGIYRDNLLTVIGNKMGKVFKDLNIKHFDLDTKVNSIEILSNDTTTAVTTLQNDLTQSISEVNASITELDTRIGTLEDFEAALNS